MAGKIQPSVTNMYNYRKNYLLKNNYQSTNACDFCTKDPKELVRQTKHAYIKTTKFKYDLWEFRDVQEHLMVIPERHVSTLVELSKAEQADIMAIIADYQAKGFNIYARAEGSITGTMQHQHTHLIKTDNKRKARLGFFIKKPYWLIKL